MTNSKQPTRKSRKVADVVTILKTRAASVSKWADDIEGILPLIPPEGWLIPVPAGKKAETYRRSVREMVTRHIEPHSSFRYRVTIVDSRDILVGCIS